MQLDPTIYSLSHVATVSSGMSGVEMDLVWWLFMGMLMDSLECLRKWPPKPDCHGKDQHRRDKGLNKYHLVRPRSS